MKFNNSTGLIEECFRSQTKFIQNAAKAYDEGREEEAKAMAAAIGVLLSDTEQSASMLAQLNMKDRIYMISTIGPYDHGASDSYHGLFNISSAGDYIPLCKMGVESVNKWLTFDDWWNELVIDDGVHVFSRKDLILSAAVQDGTGELQLFERAAYASVRQIASELLVSLNINSIKKPGTRRKRGKQEACYIGNTLYLADSPSSEDVRVTERKERTCYSEDVMLEGKRRFSMTIIS